MARALECGVGREAFWRMSPRALYLIWEERKKHLSPAQNGQRPGIRPARPAPAQTAQPRVRLNYIPRP